MTTSKCWILPGDYVKYSYFNDYRLVISVQCMNQHSFVMTTLHWSLGIVTSVVPFNQHESYWSVLVRQ
jgi:hypothetical protein